METSVKQDKTYIALIFLFESLIEISKKFDNIFKVKFFRDKSDIERLFNICKFTVTNGFPLVEGHNCLFFHYLGMLYNSIYHITL